MLSLTNPGVQAIDANLSPADLSAVAAAQAFCRAGKALCDANFQGQDDRCRFYWTALAQANHECELTLRWIDDRVEVRVHLANPHLPSARKTQTFAADFERPTIVDTAKAKLASPVNRFGAYERADD